MTRSDLINALAHPNVGAFLALIREGETNQTPNAYRMQWGSGLFYPEREWKHPNQAVTVHGITSTAAGAYQFLSKTWLALVEQYGFEDFSPPMQDLGAVALIAEKGAIEPLKAGRVHEAIARCARVWASLPGSPYGQPTAKLSRLLAAYTAAGGTVADQSAQAPEVKPVAPIVIPLLETLVPLIPALGKLFGSGSETQQRNIAAAQIAGDALVKVTNAVNLQEAVEKVRDDPDMLAAAKETITRLVVEIGEAGGGGINGARTFNTSDGAPLYKRGDFWFSLLLFVIPLILVLDVVYFHPQLWGENPRIQVLTAGLNLLSFIGGYWLGSTIQSARKTEILAAKGQAA